MFLLMFFLIGINTKDLYFLKKPDSKGRINYIRAKTSRKYSIKLEPEALEIIKKYDGGKSLINMSARYKSNLDWQKYMNIELKEIGKAITVELQKTDKKASFPENISTNWARHSWATIARNDCRIDKDDVALCLGHEDTDNRVTDIYINYDYRIIDESNRKVLDVLK
jgi:site-specific recombinase XerD